MPNERSDYCRFMAGNGYHKYKVFEEDDILAFAICLLFAPLFFTINLITIALEILYDILG